MASSEASLRAESQSTFPTDPTEFANDERISWSRLDNKHILETEQGAEYEWDEALRRWVPVVSTAPEQLKIQISGLRPIVVCEKVAMVLT